MTHSADVALVRRVIAAERAAFDALFERYADRVHALAQRRVTPPESARVLTERMLERIFADLGEYRGSVSLDTWVLCVCKRVLAGHGTAPELRAHAWPVGVAS